MPANSVAFIRSNAAQQTQLRCFYGFVSFASSDPRPPGYNPPRYTTYMKIGETPSLHRVRAGDATAKTRETVFEASHLVDDMLVRPILRTRGDGEPTAA